MAGELDGMNLLFGGGGQSQPQAQQPQQLDGMDLLFGSGSGLQQTATKQAQTKPAPQGNIISRTIDAVRGKQDPTYKDVPAFDDGSLSTVLSGLGAKLTGQDDKAYGDILSKSLGDRFKRRFQDANGYDIIEYTDDKGQMKQGYINKPGLDMEDVSRGIFGAIPYVAGGLGMGAVMKGAPLALRAAGQAGAAGATSIAGDVAAMGIGSEQGVDKGKAVMAAATGGAFEAIPGKAMLPVLGGLAGAGVGLAQDSDQMGSKTYEPSNVIGKAAIGAAGGVAVNMLARRLLGMNPGTYVQNGKLTPQGEKAAAEAGVNPAELEGAVAEEFGKVYAKTRDASQSALQANQNYFNIPSTLGQRTKDAQKLMEEKAMRQGLYGDNAKNVITELDKQQMSAIERAAMGDVVFVNDGGKNILPSTKAPGIAQQLAPGRFSRIDQPALGSGIREGLEGAREGGRQLEKQAWQGASEIKPNEEALALLPNAIKKEVSTLGIPINENTPTASKMVQFLRDYKSGKAPTAADEFLPDMAGQNVNEVRKTLGAMVRDAETSTDKTAAGAVYKAYNQWIDDAATAGHFPIDAVAKIKAGRQVSAEIKGLWEPRADGVLTPGAKRIQMALKDADTPEGIVNAIVGDVTMKSSPRPGTIEALTNLKTALAKHGDKELGQQTWNDIRLAYWQKITLKKNGEMQTPGQILENIKLAEKHQGSVYQTLYDVAERREIAKLKTALEAVVWKDPNPSGTATAMAVFSKQFLDKIMQSVPLLRTAYQFSGIPKAMGTVAANRSVAQGVRERIPSLGPAGAAAGASINALTGDR